MKGYKRGSKKEVMVGTNHHIEKVKRGKKLIHGDIG